MGQSASNRVGDSIGIKCLPLTQMTLLNLMVVSIGRFIRREFVPQDDSKPRLNSFVVETKPPKGGSFRIVTLLSSFKEFALAADLYSVYLNLR